MVLLIEPSSPSCLSIELIGREVEIEGEQEPQGVGDLEISGGAAHRPIPDHGADGQSDHHEQHHQGRQTQFQSEEEHRPEEVEQQRPGVQKMLILQPPGLHPIDKGRGHAHEDVKDGPDDGEHHRRRSQGRLGQVLKRPHPVHGHQRGEAAHQERKQDESSIGPKVIFLFHRPIVYGRGSVYAFLTAPFAHAIVRP